MNLWEEHLFSKLDEKEASTLRLKKVVEMTRFESEEQIVRECQGILRRREEQRRQEEEKRRQAAAASSFGGVMSQLKSRFEQQQAVPSVDDEEIRALQELEAALK